MVSEDWPDGGGGPGATTVGFHTGARARPSKGSRDCFPLPVPQMPQKLERLSRRSSQRLARKMHDSRRELEAIESLNWLWGFRCCS